MTACRQCSGLWRVIRSEIRLNEKRQWRGLPVDLTAIEQAKSDLAECKARGHGGPVWQRVLARREQSA